MGPEVENSQLPELVILRGAPNLRFWDGWDPAWRSGWQKHEFFITLFV